MSDGQMEWPVPVVLRGRREPGELKVILENRTVSVVGPGAYDLPPGSAVQLIAAITDANRLAMRMGPWQ